MDTIGHWSLLNHLILNTNKTKLMLISRSKHYSQCPHILLDGIELEQVSHFKSLGVWISADLTWSKHIMSVTCKVCWLLGYIFRTFSPHCSPSAIMTLYRAQVLPILDYRCITDILLDGIKLNLVLLVFRLRWFSRDQWPIVSTSF